MNVKMLTATTWQGQRLPIGAECAVEDATARRWADNRIAEIIPDEPTNPLDKMTVDELKAFAAESGIDLGEAKLKGDLLNVIKAATGQDGN